MQPAKILSTIETCLIIKCIYINLLVDLFLFSYLKVWALLAIVFLAIIPFRMIIGLSDVILASSAKSSKKSVLI